MKKLPLLFFTMLVSLGASAETRSKIDVPNIGEYITLKCDFHMHTVFSDGRVWPTVRIQEARMEGLDAISITDHVESRRPQLDGDHNDPHKIAWPGETSDVILIRGAEISRTMPPGHWNAIFLQDCNALNVKEYMDAFKAAKKQDAFIFWNHPGWWNHTPNKAVWYPEHTELYDGGYMHGIEVVNGATEYCPEAHAWALEKNLTILGNSDTHGPVMYNDYFIECGHRPMTFVFAKEKSAKGIREALDDRRTVVYHKNMIIGAEKWVRALFEGCLKVTRISHSEKETRVYLKNESQLTFNLRKEGQNEHLRYITEKVIRPHEEFSFNVRYAKPVEGRFEVNFRVENWLVGPNEGMLWTIPLE